jgi:hypothetical protein
LYRAFLYIGVAKNAYFIYSCQQLSLAPFSGFE